MRWRQNLLAPAVLAGLVACAVLAASLLDDDSATRTPKVSVRAIAIAGHPGGAAIAGGRIWTLETVSRRLRSLSLQSGAQVGGPLVVSGPATIATDIVADGDGVVVGVARADAGGGRVVHVDAGGLGRSIGTGEVTPRRVVVLPAAVIVLGTSRILFVRRSGAGRWTRPVGDGVDVGVGYGSIWTVSRTARGSVVRRFATTGRLVGRRRVSGAVTALAVGHGAVWLANGCVSGVARAPIGRGPATCERAGSAFSDVAVGGAGVWAADVDGRRVVRLAPRDGTVAASAALPGRPSEVMVGSGGAWVLSRRGGLVLVGEGQVDDGP